MKRFQVSQFHTISLGEITGVAAQARRDGWSFVQICATTLEAGVELLYAYHDPQREEPGLEGYLVEVPDGTHVPSITEWFPAAFVFENETHDLFGVQVDGINIDFKGEFYTVPVAYPMNPRAAVAGEAAQEEVPAQGEEVPGE